MGRAGRAGASPPTGTFGRGCRCPRRSALSRSDPRARRAFVRRGTGFRRGEFQAIVWAEPVSGSGGRGRNGAAEARPGPNHSLWRGRASPVATGSGEGAGGGRRGAEKPGDRALDAPPPVISSRGPGDFPAPGRPGRTVLNSELSVPATAPGMEAEHQGLVPLPSNGHRSSTSGARLPRPESSGSPRQGLSSFHLDSEVSFLSSSSPRGLQTPRASEPTHVTQH